MDKPDEPNNGYNSPQSDDYHYESVPSLLLRPALRALIPFFFSVTPDMGMAIDSTTFAAWLVSFYETLADFVIFPKIAVLLWILITLVVPGHGLSPCRNTV